MEVKVILAFILQIIPTVFSKNHIYCNLPTCPNESHTLCKYEDIGFGEDCQNPLEEGINHHTLRYIVNTHNYYRYPRIMQRKYLISVPPGTNPDLPISPLEWDLELAFIAQRWANQCIGQLDTCRNVARFNVTQRVYEIASPSSKSWYRLSLAIEDWHEDDVSNVLSSRNHRLGEASNSTRNQEDRQIQLPWDNANRIGCGFVHTEFYGNERSYLVCNYGYLNPNLDREE